MGVPRVRSPEVTTETTADHVTPALPGLPGNQKPLPSPGPGNGLCTGKTGKTEKAFGEACLVFCRHRSWRKTAGDPETLLYPSGLPEPNPQTHSPFPVFPTFPVNQALAWPGDRALHREDKKEGGCTAA